MTITRTDLAQAQKLLKAAGWEHIMTCMSSDKTSAKFGLMYAQPGITPVGEEFWLNKDTIGGPLITALRENHETTFGKI